MIRAVVMGILIAAPALAQGQTFEVQPVTEDVWAIAGETEQRSEANLADNATFGLVVAPERPVLIEMEWD